MLVGILTFIEAQQAKQRREDIKNINVKVHEALNEFITKPQITAYPTLSDGPMAGPPPTPPIAFRFPCPADPTVPAGNAMFGVEAVTGTADGPTDDDDPVDSNFVCDASGGVTQVAGSTGPVYIGVLPSATIGLGGRDAMDINGNQFTYAVSESMTQFGAAISTAPGAITMIDDNDNVITNTAPYVIVSHGDDKRGAITKSAGVAGGGCRAGAEGDAENCNNDDVFRTAYHSNIETGGFFDDLVSYNLRDVLDDDLHWNLDSATGDIFNTNSGDIRMGSSDLILVGDDADGIAPLIIDTDAGGDPAAIELQTDGARNGGLAYDFGADRMVMDAETGAIALNAQGNDTLIIDNLSMSVNGDSNVSGDSTVTGNIGVGGAVPITDADINMAGIAKFGDGTCNVNTVGAIRYNAAMDRMEYCDSTPVWQPLQGGAQVNSACGTAHLTTTGTAPSGGNPTLCNPGTASNDPALDSGSTWTWSCFGSGGGGNVNCLAYKPLTGMCGPADGVPSATAPTGPASLCNQGAPDRDPATDDGSGNWVWVCEGTGGNPDDNCSAPILDNGQCGSADGTTTSSAPSGSELCDAGTASDDPALDDGSGNWVWDCLGENGGTTDSCSASQPAAPQFRAGCYIDTPLWDEVQEDSCFGQIMEFCGGTTSTVTFSAGDTTMSTPDDTYDFSFSDGSYEVRWTGYCDSGGWQPVNSSNAGWCTESIGCYTTEQATVEIRDTVTGVVVFTRTVDARLEGID